jgi:hypothetical protein
MRRKLILFTGICFLINVVFPMCRNAIGEHKLLAQALQNQKQVLDPVLAAWAFPLKALDRLVVNNYPLTGRIVPGRSPGDKRSSAAASSDYAISSPQRGACAIQSFLETGFSGLYGVLHGTVSCAQEAQAPSGGPPGIPAILMLLFLLSPRRNLPEGNTLACCCY